jgi:hypothetical protein
MLALIRQHTSRGRDIPEEHVLELAALILEENEPRAVRALNLLEKKKGSPLRYTADIARMALSSSTIN